MTYYFKVLGDINNGMQRGGLPGGAMAAVKAVPAIIMNEATFGMYGAMEAFQEEKSSSSSRRRYNSYQNSQGYSQLNSADSSAISQVANQRLRLGHKQIKEQREKHKLTGDVFFEINEYFNALQAYVLARSKENMLKTANLILEEQILLMKEKGAIDWNSLESLKAEHTNTAEVLKNLKKVKGICKGQPIGEHFEDVFSKTKEIEKKLRADILVLEADLQYEVLQNQLQTFLCNENEQMLVKEEASSRDLEENFPPVRTVESLEADFIALHRMYIRAQKLNTDRDLSSRLEGSIWNIMALREKKLTRLSLWNSKHLEAIIEVTTGWLESCTLLASSREHPILELKREPIEKIKARATNAMMLIEDLSGANALRQALKEVNPKGTIDEEYYDQVNEEFSNVLGGFYDCYIRLQPADVTYIQTQIVKTIRQNIVKPRICFCANDYYIKPHKPVSVDVVQNWFAIPEQYMFLPNIVDILHRYGLM